MLDMGQIIKGGRKADFEDDIREMIRTSLMADQESPQATESEASA